MDNNKLVHENIYDFKLKDGQIVNAIAFNNIFHKFLDNDESLMHVRDKYCYGPKTFKPIGQYYVYDDLVISSGILSDFIEDYISDTKYGWKQCSLSTFSYYNDYVDENDQESRQLNYLKIFKADDNSISNCNMISNLQYNDGYNFYTKQGYKVWQNINNTKTGQRVVPGWRKENYDIYKLKSPEDFLKRESSAEEDVPTDPKDHEYYSRYVSSVTALHTDEFSAWDSELVDNKEQQISSNATEITDEIMSDHINAWHKSTSHQKEISLGNHKPSISNMEETIIIKADLPQSIKKISNTDYINCQIKNPFTFVSYYGHDGLKSTEYHDVGVTPTGYIIEYASGIKMIYINIPTTKTYWIPFANIRDVVTQDGYVNFFNLPFDSSVYKSRQPERNYHGLGNGQTLYGCDDTTHKRPKNVDLSQGTFITDLKITIRNVNVGSVYSANISNESPALKRVQFGYSDVTTGLFKTQHGGDNSYYPPSLFIEKPSCQDGSIILRCCIFGSDSQNVMIICK